MVLGLVLPIPSLGLKKNCSFNFCEGVALMSYFHLNSDRLEPGLSAWYQTLPPNGAKPSRVGTN